MLTVAITVFVSGATKIPLEMLGGGKLSISTLNILSGVGGAQTRAKKSEYWRFVTWTRPQINRPANFSVCWMCNN